MSLCRASNNRSSEPPLIAPRSSLFFPCFSQHGSDFVHQRCCQVFQLLPFVPLLLSLPSSPSQDASLISASSFILNRQPFHHSSARNLRSRHRSIEWSSASVRSLQGRPVASDPYAFCGGVRERDPRSHILGRETVEEGEMLHSHFL